MVAYQVATRSTLGMWNNAKLNLACFHKAKSQLSLRANERESVIRKKKTVN